MEVFSHILPYYTQSSVMLFRFLLRSGIRHVRADVINHYFQRTKHKFCHVSNYSLYPLFLSLSCASPSLCSSVHPSVLLSIYLGFACDWETQRQNKKQKIKMADNKNKKIKTINNKTKNSV